MSVQHIADQRAAFEAALRIAKDHPTLPAAYITVHRAGRMVSFQLGGLADWEQWRAALAVAPVDVEAVALGTGDWLLTFDAVVGGYDLHVYVIDQVRSALKVEATA